MSEVITEKSVTDTLGRVITLRVLDPADMLDLLEAAGSASSNAGWVRYASVIASVASIDGIPVPAAARKADIHTTARRLGNEGFAAVGTYLSGDGTDPAAGVAVEDVAKN